MKKWQKITGLIALSLIAIYELLTWANTYVYLKYVVEPTDNDLLIEQSYIYIDALSFGMWMNLALAVFLFIYLWRKSMTKTCSSPIKTISDEKTTIPFTFERAYCRIGVATDNSGIERMEVYFVRNDKTAICYRNCSFNQVIIDDAKLDKYDNLEIRGDIISIRATTGLANYIINSAFINNSQPNGPAGMSDCGLRLEKKHTKRELNKKKTKKKMSTKKSTGALKQL